MPSRTRRYSKGHVGAVVVLSVLQGAASCSGRPADSADHVWRSVLAPCAAGDQVRNVLFLSTSNNIGPGSIWRKAEGGGYQVVRLLDSTAIGAKAAVNRGAQSTCDGRTASIADVSGAVGLEKLAKLVGATAAVEAEFRRARTITVGVNSWAWDELLVGPFRDMVGRMDSTTGYRRDLESDSLVVGRAVRVDGLTATLDFDRRTADSVRLRLPRGLGSVQQDWVGADSSSLRISTPGPIYIAVQLYPWRKGNFAAPSFTAIPLESSAHVVPNPSIP